MRSWHLKRPRRRFRHVVCHALGMVGALLGFTGCSLENLLNTDQLPANVTDPAVTKTPDGALAVYRGVVMLFGNAFGGTSLQAATSTSSFAETAAFLADELVGEHPADLRVFSAAMVDQNPYASLQRIRGQAGQATSLLTDFAPGQQALAGHVYALEGYAEMFLAELYCSGIPLSTLDYDGDYTLKPGSTTDKVFDHAVALFDTALTLASDSAHFQHLAAVGKGRALLGLGQYAAAAAAVAAVPDAYHYDIHYTVTPLGTGNAGAPNFGYAFRGDLVLISVADREGSNGLDYITSSDPRIEVTFHPAATIGNTVHPAYSTPNKLGTGVSLGASSIVLASGVEARLIEAEAALQANPNDGAWLLKLNALRTDGTQNGGGTYNPGTGGVAGLAPLVDPGTDAARVDLLFRERAFWLFLTGHRQGDLRRLIRQYGRLQSDVYPTGFHQGTAVRYGADVTLPVPQAEQTTNPLYTGCIAPGA